MESINASDVNQRDAIIQYQQQDNGAVGIRTLPEEGFDVTIFNVTLPNDGEYSVAGKLFT